MPRTVYYQPKPLLDPPPSPLPDCRFKVGKGQQSYRQRSQGVFEAHSGTPGAGWATVAQPANQQGGGILGKANQEAKVNPEL